LGTHHFVGKNCRFFVGKATGNCEFPWEIRRGVQKLRCAHQEILIKKASASSCHGHHTDRVVVDGKCLNAVSEPVSDTLKNEPAKNREEPQRSIINGFVE